MKIRLEITRTWKNERKSRDNDKTLIIQSAPCLKFEDIFCFCVENLCGHQTIGWLVKFRGVLV